MLLIVSRKKRGRCCFRVQYDVKLSYGLNVLSFNCKVAPALSKKIKNTFIEEEEVAGDTQGINCNKCKNMDVETITFYVVCTSGCVEL